MTNSCTPRTERSGELWIESRCMPGDNAAHIVGLNFRIPLRTRQDNIDGQHFYSKLPVHERVRTRLKVLADEKRRSIGEDDPLAASPEGCRRQGRRLKRSYHDEFSARDPSDISECKGLRTSSEGCRRTALKSRTVSSDEPLAVVGTRLGSKQRHRQPSRNACSCQHEEPKVKCPPLCVAKAQDNTRRSVRIKERIRLKKKKIREEKQSGAWMRANAYDNLRRKRPIKKRQKSLVSISNRDQTQGRKHGKEGWSSPERSDRIVSRSLAQCEAEVAAIDEATNWKSRLRKRRKRTREDVDNKFDLYADHCKNVNRKANGGQNTVARTSIEPKVEERDVDALGTWMRRHRRNTRTRARPLDVLSSATEEEPPIAPESRGIEIKQLTDERNPDDISEKNECTLAAEEISGKTIDEPNFVVKHRDDNEARKVFFRRKARNAVGPSGTSDVVTVQAPERNTSNQPIVEESQDCVPLVSTSLDAKLQQVQHSSVEKPSEFIAHKGDSTDAPHIAVKPTVIVPITEEAGDTDGQTNALLQDASPEERVAEVGGPRKPFFTTGLRCGLCGGNSYGEPPPEVLPDAVKNPSGTIENSDDYMAAVNEGRRFGDKKGWLGRLLGPLSERVGVAGAWVHEICAIWSPEVYFAGVGRLKNVKAAIRRGRHLKCFRCSQPGATIGCRVDRCLQNFHLPCARFEGCVFDHKKYLMACPEHIYLFRPSFKRNLGRGCVGHRANNEGTQRLYRGNFKRVMQERKAAAVAARLKDLEEEEKYLDKSGEDEEFMKREHKRLQRDLARITPIMLGGPAANGATSLFPGGWDTVAGLENVVDSLKEIVILPLLYPEAFPRMGITPPRGLLLHGHPGTGKTLVVRALASACASGPRQVAYFSRKGADCLGKYVGDAERQLRLLFQVAERLQPSIIFFDEIDGLAPSRARDGQDQTHSSVVSTLLALMDGLNTRGSVIVIGATNRPDALDPALRRPGRFDREIYFPLPSVEDRASILALHTCTWDPCPSKEVLSAVARGTGGFAGADLQALCAETAMMALKRVAPLHHLMRMPKKGNTMNLLALPRIEVKAVDWNAALKKSSPCSMRLASSALNYVPSAPLPWYLAPILLPTIVKVLVGLHLDKRSSLPPALSNFVSSVIEVLRRDEDNCAVSQISLSSSRCGSNQLANLLSIIKSYPWDHSLKEVLEELAAVAGIVSSKSKSRQRIHAINEVVDSERAVDASVGESMSLKGAMPSLLRGRFRLLLTGSAKHGQELVACALLHSFEGYADVHKLTLPTMLHEGHGSAVDGLVHILGGLNYVTPCLLYMPHIESWALETFIPDGESLSSTKNCHSEESNFETISVNEDALFVATPLWRTWMQKMNCLPPDTSLMLLATCHVGVEKLPLEVAEFFNQASRVATPCLKHLIVPCVAVELPILKDSAAVLQRASQQAASELAARYLQHLRCPQGTSSESIVSYSISKMVSTVLPTDGESMMKLQHERVVSTTAEKESLTNPSVHPGKSTCMATSEDYAGHVRNNYLFWTEEQRALEAAVGYFCFQLLYQPQFSELRYATSRLTTGPSLNARDIDICHNRSDRELMKFYSHGEGNPATDVNVSDSDESQDEEAALQGISVYGLVAVGIKGNRGFYFSTTEVASEITTVLTLLKKRISDKLQCGKDSWKYTPILAKAASLSDIVSVWVHHHRRLELAATSSIPGTVASRLELAATSSLPGIVAEKGTRKFEEHELKNGFLHPSKGGETRAKSPDDKMDQPPSCGKFEAATDKCERNRQHFIPKQECLNHLQNIFHKYFLERWNHQRHASTVEGISELITDCTASAISSFENLVSEGVHEDLEWCFLTQNLGNQEIRKSRCTFISTHGPKQSFDLNDASQGTLVCMCLLINRMQMAGIF